LHCSCRHHRLGKNATLTQSASHYGNLIPFVMSIATAAFIRKFEWGLFILFVGLLMLPNLAWLWSVHDIGVWLDAVIVPGVFLLVYFALLGSRLWLACLMLAPFALLAPLEVFYISRYQGPSTSAIIAAMFASNPREVREYLGAALIPACASIAAASALIAFTLWRLRRADLRWRHRSRNLVLVIAIAAPPILAALAWMTAKTDVRDRMRTQTPGLLLKTVVAGYPFGVLPRFAEYCELLRRSSDNVARVEAFRFHAHRIGPSEQRQVYVFVIGESSSRDHWQLFGYDRATNPELSKLPNLVRLPDMLTPWVVSLDAIPQLLTRKPINDNVTPWPEASIVRAMREAGYQTYWISNQQQFGKFDSAVSIYANEAGHQQFLNHASWEAPGEFDEDLLEALSAVLKASTDDVFIVLHMMGSHNFYDYRYPNSFKHFQPTNSDAKDLTVEGMTNSYDNTILYSDHVIAQIIDRLAGTNAISAMWFASDHGDLLPSPACPKTGHGHGTRHEFEVPALFWYSDAYLSAFPDRVAALEANANQRTLTADSFESLIDMAGVDFPGHDISRSLFNRAWSYRPRLVSRLWTSDFDRAVFDKNCQIVLSNKP